MIRPTTIPAAFVEHRALLAYLIDQIRGQLDADPDAGLSQDDRLKAWCNATEQFISPDYWPAALTVHEAHKRAHAAETARGTAERAAQELQGHHAAARLEADQRTAAHDLHFPAQKI